LQGVRQLTPAGVPEKASRIDAAEVHYLTTALESNWRCSC
jgi:hypothetical protein